MTQAERRHDRLAVRLSLIISRLVAGETLNVSKLAAEFGVSVRTLRRDFRERLIYLDLDYHRGQYRLLSGNRQRELTVMTFARQSGIEALFPDLDCSLINSLLSGPGESPCLIWQGRTSVPTLDTGIFSRLVSAISEERKITLLINGSRHKEFFPYRLILFNSEWYLAGAYQAHVAVLPLIDIRAVTIQKEGFPRDTAIQDICSRSDFIQALPHFRMFNILLTSANNRNSLLKETI